MAASATFGRAGSADTARCEPTHRGEERKHARRGDAPSAQSALSSSVISFTDALASPKSIAVLAL